MHRKRLVARVRGSDLVLSYLILENLGEVIYKNALYTLRDAWSELEELRF